LLLDIGLREEIEETMTLLVDDRMSFFLKKNFYSKNLSTLIENTENINFQEISRKYGINLKTIFPNLARFSTSHRAFFKEKGKNIFEVLLVILFKYSIFILYEQKRISHTIL
jgi:hypothetical protein